MSKYRLKDKALQKRLDAATGGNFSYRLQDPDFVERMEFKSFEIAAVTLLLLKTEIEKIPEYTTKGWNPWPEVEAPEGEPMRVEFVWNDGSLGRCCGKLRNGTWVSSDDPNLEIECVKRFRPWDDDDDDDDEEDK